MSVTESLVSGPAKLVQDMSSFASSFPSPLHRKKAPAMLGAVARVKASVLLKIGMHDYLEAHAPGSVKPLALTYRPHRQLLIRSTWLK